MKRTIFCLVLSGLLFEAISEGSYVVRKGDTLYSIARNNKVELSLLRKANGLSESSVIQEGQKLVIPGSQSSQNTQSTSSAPKVSVTAQKPSSQTVAKTESAKVHVVSNGDTLYSIARKYGVKVEDLTRINNLKASSIYVGQRLNLSEPARVSSTTSSSSSSTKTVNSSSANNQVKNPSTSSGDINVIKKETISKTNDNSTNTKVSQSISTEKKYEPVAQPVVKAPKKESKEAVGSSGKPSAPKSTSSSKDLAKTGVNVDPKEVLWPLNNPEIRNITGKVGGVLLTGKENESVKCIHEGTVMYTGLYRGFGEVVFVQDKTGLIYSYSGLRSVRPKKGDHVAMGDELGRTGKGSESNIKFMVFQNGSPIDPVSAPRG